ncbi:MAG: site-specific integrase [Erysipelotrichia bacterium]|nr:site-specific integrase [Erysipelotrichia bacterium]
MSISAIKVQEKIIHDPKTRTHFFTREGNKVDVSGDSWILPVVYRHSRLNFFKIKNDFLKRAIKEHVLDQATRVSSHAGCVFWSDVSALVISRQEKFSLDNSLDIKEFEGRLIAIMEEAINNARSKNKLWVLYRTVRWYIWSAENFSELGFSKDYAKELMRLEIPGNPKGEAVRQAEHNSGPLHRVLELQPIIEALKQDDSKEYDHLQQKAALALSIAFGRNPANLTFLKEKDFLEITSDSVMPCYILKIPRIKKRQLNSRDDLQEEYLEPEIAKHVLNLIEASKETKLTIEVGGEVKEIEKPLFINKSINKSAVDSKNWNDAFNMWASQITELLKSFIKRHNIISPITGELIKITTRRLRYTLATGLVAEGISRAELARILDHSDTQHVHVYFEVANQIVEHLDKAMAKGFSKYLNFFKGNIIDENDKGVVNAEREDKHLIYIDEHNPKEQVNIGVCGESSVCHLDPPYSCYLCPKFQPYRHADHEHVLDCLLANREERLEKYENARLGIQLDEVIAAVAQVATLCSGGDVNA